jgi:hypothetical protein
MNLLTELLDIIQSLAAFFSTAVRELFDILSLTRQLADLVSNFLRMFGF